MRSIRLSVDLYIGINRDGDAGGGAAGSAGALVVVHLDEHQEWCYRVQGRVIQRTGDTATCEGAYDSLRLVRHMTSCTC